MNLKKTRDDFPLLKNIVYFDNACMTLKPQQVIDKVVDYYSNFPACAGRSYHKLGKKATEEVEKARKTIAKFAGAREDEIVFTKNTTEALNLVANSAPIEKGTILTTDKEHNSNLLPIQMMTKRGFTHKVVLSNEDNTFSLENFENMMSNEVKLVSMVHTSNLDGTTIPKEIIKIAHDYEALVCLDAAQSMPHKEINVKKLDVDFLAWSGHKMLGPTGTGALFAKKDLLAEMKPFLVGGETVVDSTYETHEMEPAPRKFEAGLQHYAGIIGFAEAAKYLDKIGKSNIEKHEQKLNKKLSEAALSNDKLSLIGPTDASFRSGIFSFNVKGIDPHTVAMVMDSSKNVMIRSGAHCVHSWFNAHNMQGSARASMYFYNTEEEVDVFLEALEDVLRL